MSIQTYKRTDLNEPFSYSKVGNATEKIQKFVKYLHDFLPVIEEEFNDLEKRSKTSPNEIFPIKMNALQDIYNAAEPLYKWYVERRKQS